MGNVSRVIEILRKTQKKVIEIQNIVIEIKKTYQYI